MPRWQQFKGNLKRRLQSCVRIKLQGCEFKKQQIGNLRQSWRGFGNKGRWARPSTGKVVVIQLIIEELLLRLWIPCGHVG